jgi:hypothetical protein
MGVQKEIRCPFRLLCSYDWILKSFLGGNLFIANRTRMATILEVVHTEWNPAAEVALDQCQDPGEEPVEVTHFEGHCSADVLSAMRTVHHD